MLWRFIDSVKTGCLRVIDRLVSIPAWVVGGSYVALSYGEIAVLGPYDTRPASSVVSIALVVGYVVSVLPRGQAGWEMLGVTTLVAVGYRALSPPPEIGLPAVLIGFPLVCYVAWDRRPSVRR